MTTPTPPAAPPAQDPQQTDPGSGPPTQPAPKADPKPETDWKAEARKWEQRAKDNSNAAKELEKVKAANMSDTEKAVTEAEKRGRTAASLDAGKRLASAELRAAAAAKGVDLSELGDLIDTSRFVDEAGDVDTDAIGKAVDRLAKLAPKAPQRASGDFSGGPGTAEPIGEDQLDRMSPQEITDAYNAGKLKHLM